MPFPFEGPVTVVEDFEPIAAEGSGVEDFDPIEAPDFEAVNAVHTEPAPPVEPESAPVEVASTENTEPAEPEDTPTGRKKDHS